jgi:hypothetical protein
MIRASPARLWPSPICASAIKATCSASVVRAASTTVSKGHGTSGAVPLIRPSCSAASAIATVNGPLSGTGRPTLTASHAASRSVSAMGTAAACLAKPVQQELSCPSRGLA